MQIRGRVNIKLRKNQGAYVIRENVIYYIIEEGLYRGHEHLTPTIAYLLWIMTCLTTIEVTLFIRNRFT